MHYDSSDTLDIM